MVHFLCQLDWIWNHLGDTCVWGVFLRDGTEEERPTLMWIASSYGVGSPTALKGVRRKLAEHLRSSFSASWLKTQYDQLPHAPACCHAFSTTMGCARKLGTRVSSSSLKLLLSGIFLGTMRQQQMYHSTHLPKSNYSSKEKETTNNFRVWNHIDLLFYTMDANTENSTASQRCCHGKTSCKMCPRQIA